MIPRTRLPIELNPVFWREKGEIQLWKIGEKLNVSEMTLIRWLRKPIDAKKMEEILEVINQLKNESSSYKFFWECW